MRRLFKDSLQGKIFVFTLLIIFVPLTALGVFFYYQSMNLTIDKLKAADENVVEQIGSNLSFVLEDVHDLSLFFIQSDQGQDLLTNETATPAELNENKRSVEQLLLHLIGSKDYIFSVQIEKAEDVLVHTGPRTAAMSEEQRARLNERNGGGLLTVHEDSSSLSYSRLVKNVNNVTEPLGYLTITIHSNYLDQLFQSKVTGDYDRYFLLHGGKTVVSKGTLYNDRDTLEILENVEETVQSSGTEVRTIEKDRYIQSTRDIEGTSLAVVHLVSLDALMQDSTIIPAVVVMALIVSLFICAFVAFQFSRYIVRPMKELQSLMKQVEQREFNVRYAPKGLREIDHLGAGFNSMLERITFLIDMVYLAQIKSKEAELKALYAQINPHFLYNTLDTIYWMGQMENAVKSSEMVHALSRLFRLLLKDQKEVWTVEEEVNYARHYLDIQKVRFEDTIQFEIDVDPDASKLPTVKMVLQPLIENAISHGIEPQGEGIIRIRIQRVADELEMTVEDNGVGADPEELKELLEREVKGKRGFAVKNIHERVLIHSGGDCGLSFHRNSEGGLTVVVKQKGEVAE
ncbi:sensor histidine kinase [Halobacillus kuroshimensis]|uniref:Sensor histidine kinase n=1 Tax=Halobacillus kuroshimensis TaxID=302481 RepID=A0ABS3DYG7_9BACI|nr:sensor histidine kinase [Halobacillus kuroshimensis]